MPSANALAVTKRLADAYFTGTFRLLLVTGLPSEANLDAFSVRSDVPNAHPASGTYPAEGVVVSCTVGVVDPVNNRTPVTFGAPAQRTGTTISAVGAWIYKVMGTAGTDQLVGFIDFGGTVSSSNGTYDVAMTSPLYINR